jgi:protein CpxP
MTLDTTPASAPAPRRRWGRRILLGILLFALGGFAGFAAGTHKAAAMFWHGMHHMTKDPQAVADRVASRVDHVLSHVDASADQKEKVEAAAKAAVLDLAKLDIDPRETHQKFLALIRADTIDPAALEALRAAQIAKWDAASKRIVQALAEAAPALTPAQRRELTEPWQPRWAR